MRTPTNPVVHPSAARHWRNLDWHWPGESDSIELPVPWEAFIAYFGFLALLGWMILSV